MKRFTFSQFVFDQLLKVASRRGVLWTKFIRILLGQARHFLISVFHDPLVAYELDGSSLLLPLSHELPFIRVKYPLYSTNVGRIANALKEKYPNLTMVDIGANVGDTAAIVRNLAEFPILCIDGDYSFFSLLERNSRNWRGVYLERAYVGETTAAIRARVDAAGGTGRIVTDALAVTQIQTKTLSDILATFPLFTTPKLVKIDTDGFDTRIIKGELQLLRRLRPAVFFEYDPLLFAKNDEDGFAVFSSLRSAGYQFALFFENTGEFLAKCDLDNGGLLEEMHNFCLSKSVRRYCDVCVFVEDDVDVLDNVRLRELQISLQKNA